MSNSNESKESRISVKDMAFVAMFSALIAVCSIISIPIGEVPITLQTFAVCLAAAMLGWKRGTLSVFIYVLLGAVGVPVFAGFKGGPGVLAGPTGGYIIGYIVMAAVSGLLLVHLCGKEGQEGYTYPKIAVSLVAGLAFCYLLGSIWFYIISGWTIRKVLMSCVVVFLPGDALKIAAASFLIRRVRPQVQRYLTD